METLQEIMLEMTEKHRLAEKRAIIEQKLLNIGIRSNLSGFDCLVDAILIYKPSMSLTKKDGLYDRVAKFHNTNKTNIERRIRHARERFVEDIENGIIPEDKKKYMLGKEKMANGEFISVLRLMIDNEMTTEEVM